MRKVLLGLLLLLIPSVAWAQEARYDNIVIGPRGPVANATIAVCSQPASTGTKPCSPLATLFTDSTGSVQAPNPLIADDLGNYHFYVAPGTYTIQIYSPQLPIPFVMVDQAIGIGGGGGSSAWNLITPGTNTSQGFAVTPSATETLPLFTYNCFAGGFTSGTSCLSLTSTQSEVSSMSFYGHATGPFGSQDSVPISMNIPTINSLDTVRVFSLTNGGPGTTCSAGQRMDGDGFYVFDGNCSIAFTTPITQVFGGLIITDNQNTQADDFLINSHCTGVPDCTKTAGAVIVDWFDAANGTEFFKAPDNESPSNNPSFLQGVGALSFHTLSSAPALSGVLRLSHSDSIDFRNNANSADDTITVSAADLPLWNGGAWPGSGGGGVTFPLAANQNANNADTILYTRFTDTSPTGFAWRLQNHAASSTLASLDVSGNLIANTLTLNNQSTFTLSPTGAVQPFFKASSATAGASNIAPGYFEACTSPANASCTYLFPTSSGGFAESTTTPAADSSQTLAVHGPVNAQTGTTYTISSADEDGLTTFNNAASIAVSLACPSGTNFLNGWVDDLQQIGAGAPTVTVSGCTINGSVTLVVPTTGVRLKSDGANYRAIFNGTGGGGGVTLQTIEANNASQSLLDFDASTANVTGLAVTPSNPSGGKEVMEVSGNLNAANVSGTLALGNIPNIPLNQVASPTAAVSAFSRAAAWILSLDNSTTATVSTTNATPTFDLCAHYWATGGVDTDSCLGETMSFAAGLNGLATVKFANPATTGGTLFDFSNGGTQSDSLTLGPTTSSTANINGVQTIFGGGSSQGSLGFRVGASGGSYSFQSSGGVTEFGITASTGVVSNIGSITAVGLGVPAERYNTAATNQTASIGATTMVTAPAADTNYEFQAYVGQLNAGTTCTTAGSVGVNVIYTDPVTGSVYTFVMDVQLSGGTLLGTTVPLSSSTLTVGNTGSFRFSFRAKASTNVQFSTTYTAGSCVTGQAYNIYPKLFQQ